MIPNGLDCAAFARARPRPEWAGPGPTIAFLGRTEEPRKGLAVLLAAFPAVLARHPTARLLVAGRSNPSAWAGATVPDVMSRVEFLGQVSDTDRARLLASATVYVAPQTGGESFGIVLVEAMAAGSTVVASALPAFRAVLGDGRFGELFAVGDAAGCARAIDAALADPARRTALRKRAEEEVGRYDWSRLIADIEAVYAAVAAPADASAV